VRAQGAGAQQGLRMRPMRSGTYHSMCSISCWCFHRCRHYLLPYCRHTSEEVYSTAHACFASSCAAQHGWAAPNCAAAADAALLLQIVASLVPGTSLGRSSLTTRFTSRTHIAAMGYPSQESLSSIYTSLSGEVRHRSCEPPCVGCSRSAGQHFEAVVYRNCQAGGACAPWMNADSVPS
jgi:hypothetical protein